MSGIGLMTVYITRVLILIQEQTNNEFPISPLVGSLIIGVSSTVFAILSAVVVTYLGMRTIFILGTLIMATSLTLVGLGLQYKWFITAYCFMVVFMFAFSNTGSIVFIYVAGVAVD